MLIRVANHTECKCQEPQMIRRHALPHRKNGSVLASLSQINTVTLHQWCHSSRLIFIINVQQEMLEMLRRSMLWQLALESFLNLTDAHAKVIVNGVGNLIKAVCFWKRSSKRLLDQLRLWTSTTQPLIISTLSRVVCQASSLTVLISLSVCAYTNPPTGVFPSASQKTPDCVTEGLYGTVWRIGVYHIPPANKVRKTLSFAF